MGRTSSKKISLIPKFTGGGASKGLPRPLLFALASDFNLM